MMEAVKKERGRPVQKKGSQQAQVPISETKLSLILISRGMSQQDLIDKIKEVSGKTIGRDRISKIVSGKLRDYMISTARIIASSLDLTIEEIVEI